MRLPHGFVWLFGSLFLLAAAQGQKPSFKQEKLHGRDAYVLENSKMRVSALRGAGHIGEIRNTHLPWEGKVVARGLEFGTTPFGGSMKNVLERGSIHGVPLYRWIAARERATTRYVAFLSEIPAVFRGVEDVRAGDGKIVITERGSDNTITLKSERQW